MKKCTWGVFHRETKSVWSSNSVKAAQNYELYVHTALMNVNNNDKRLLFSVCDKMKEGIQKFVNNKTLTRFIETCIWHLCRGLPWLVESESYDDWPNVRDLHNCDCNISNPKMKIQSSSSHPHASWRSGLVYQSAKHYWSFTGKLCCRIFQTVDVNGDHFSFTKWYSTDIHHKPAKNR